MEQEDAWEEEKERRRAMADEARYKGRAQEGRDTHMSEGLWGVLAYALYALVLWVCVMILCMTCGVRELGLEVDEETERRRAMILARVRGHKRTRKKKRRMRNGSGWGLDDRGDLRAGCIL